MLKLKDFMSASTFYDILCSLNYINMNQKDKTFITHLYERYTIEKEDMELTKHQYARLNELDFIQSEYIYDKDFKKYLSSCNIIEL